MSLYVLDTDILSLFQRGHPVVCQRAAAHPITELRITVITVEEQLSGWYALLRSVRGRDQLEIAYQSLADSIPFLAQLTILGFPESAQLGFEQPLLETGRAQDGPAYCGNSLGARCGRCDAQRP